MDLKPKFNTSTINFSKPVQTTSFENKIIKDPSGQISNGIYGVIKWEKIRQIVVISILLTLMTAIGILIALFLTIIKTSWVGYIIPLATFSYALIKLFLTLIDKKALNRGVEKYREDLKIGITSHPPFMIRMYSKLHEKQITHNWLTFFLLFNGGILTLALWGLKDKSWWIFKFDVWIKDIFHNPDVMQWFMTASLILIAVVHVYFAIQRKRRILEIDSYFGANIIPYKDIQEMKFQRNKAYRRMFIIYLLIIFIIPILLKMVLKVIRRK